MMSSLLVAPGMDATLPPIQALVLESQFLTRVSL